MDAAESGRRRVRLSSGSARGRMEDGLAVFRGIPFARPPVGDLRLAAPVHVDPWEGVREAVAFGPPPPQSRLMGAPAARDVEGDWLTVNVWSPDLGAARLPVMVWVQGGGYVYGWSGDPLFDGAALARDGVVVVTFNYRLGAEGFGHFPGVPANRALLDQVAALRWVQDNIDSFGGDPGRVTLFGESAGAGCIAALMVAPSAVGLFRRAITQSVPGLYFTEALATDIATALSTHLRLPPAASELARVPPSRLSAAADEVAGKMAANSRWGEAAYLQTPFAPVVDGEVLPAPALACSGRRSRLRCGADSRPHPGRVPSLHGRQGRARGDHSRAGRRHPTDPRSRPGRVPRRSSLGRARRALRARALRPTVPEAASLAAHVRAAWTAFAATGDPGWPTYDAREQSTWIIDSSPAVAAYPEQASRQLWSGHPFAALDLVTPGEAPDAAAGG